MGILLSKKNNRLPEKMENPAEVLGRLDEKVLAANKKVQKDTSIMS